MKMDFSSKSWFENFIGVNRNWDAFYVLKTISFKQPVLDPVEVFLYGLKTLIF